MIRGEQTLLGRHPGLEIIVAQQRNAGVTEIVEIPGRGHALTIDSGWREVADTALGFVKRFAT